jgi:POT family proton-dependent oligopeptide transporter
MFYQMLTEATVRRKPVGSILTSSFKVFSAALKSKFKMDATKPEYQRIHYGRKVEWSGSFVEELKLALVACRVLLVISTTLLVYVNMY